MEACLNHVLLHQTIIGLEAKKQLKLAGEKKVDIVIGCAGGGSNFAGLSFPFVADKINGANIKIMPIEPTSCPSMTRGPFSYDFGDTAGMTPLLAMYTLGHDFIPAPIHAGGLRYHGMAPLGLPGDRRRTARTKGISTDQMLSGSHDLGKNRRALSVRPRPATQSPRPSMRPYKAREEGKEKVILFSYSGHGLMDLSGYDAFMSGKLTDYELPEEDLKKFTAPLKSFPKAEMKKTGKW